MTARKTASSNGSVAIQQRHRQQRRRPARPTQSCTHHWVLGNTRYPVHDDNGGGQINLGRTRGHCKKCGVARRWEAYTPDSIYGMDSVISFNIRLESDTLPKGFELEDEDYDA